MKSLEMGTLVYGVPYAVISVIIIVTLSFVPVSSLSSLPDSTGKLTSHDAPQSSCELVSGAIEVD